MRMLASGAVVISFYDDHLSLFLSRKKLKIQFHQHNIVETMKTVSFAKTTPETSTCSKLQRHASQALQRPSTTSQFPSFVARWAPGVASAAVQLLAVASLAAAPSVEVVSLASFAATLQHPQPAMANTENYTITVRGDESQPEEQYFQTVPQGLSAQDQRPRGPKLSTLLDGKHGKEVQVKRGAGKRKSFFFVLA